jgi:hypothetical protein
MYRAPLRQDQSSSSATDDRRHAPFFRHVLLGVVGLGAELLLLNTGCDAVDRCAERADRGDVRHRRIQALQRDIRLFQLVMPVMSSAALSACICTSRQT